MPVRACSSLDPHAYPAAAETYASDVLKMHDPDGAMLLHIMFLLVLPTNPSIRTSIDYCCARRRLRQILSRFDQYNYKYTRKQLRKFELEVQKHYRSFFYCHLAQHWGFLDALSLRKMAAAIGPEIRPANAERTAFYDHITTGLEEALLAFYAIKPAPKKAQKLIPRNRNKMPPKKSPPAKHDAFSFMAELIDDADVFTPKTFMRPGALACAGILDGCNPAAAAMCVIDIRVGNIYDPATMHIYDPAQMKKYFQQIVGDFACFDYKYTKHQLNKMDSEIANYIATIFEKDFEDIYYNPPNQPTIWSTRALIERLELRLDYEPVMLKMLVRAFYAIKPLAGTEPPEPAPKEA